MEKIKQTSIALLVLLILGSGCRPVKNGDYVIGSITNYEIASGFYAPGSLDTLDAGFIFCQSPAFTGATARAFSQVPSLHTLHPDGDTSLLFFRFDTLNPRSLFYGWTTSLPGNQFLPGGLLLNVLPLPDQSFLFSNNLSENLYRLYHDGATLRYEVFKEGFDILGISDMLLDTDGRVYATQQRHFIEHEPDSCREKRVISFSAVDGCDLREEFTLPNIKEVFEPIGAANKIDIIKNNSGEGDAKFYVTDAIGGVVYKVNQEHQVVRFVSDLVYPSSLAIQSNGKLIICTGPVLTGMFSRFVKYPELLEIDPRTARSIVLHEITDWSPDLFSGSMSALQDAGYAPYDCYMSTCLVEGEDEMELYYTFSTTGDVGKFLLEKEY